jgi:hypothetical protein
MVLAKCITSLKRKCLPHTKTLPLTLNRVTPAPRVKNTQNNRKGVGVFIGKNVEDKDEGICHLLNIRYSGIKHSCTISNVCRTILECSCTIFVHTKGMWCTFWHTIYTASNVRGGKNDRLQWENRSFVKENRLFSVLNKHSVNAKSQKVLIFN